MNSVDFRSGARDSLPICAGYFGVSFSLGIACADAGISAPMAALLSLTNVTSAGEFAGIGLIAANAAYFELFLTQFIINLRYGLMSLTLTQHLAPGTGTLKRLVMAYGNTDEIFAIAVSRPRPVTLSYMAGLEWFPILSWTLGTFLGAAAGDVLPAALMSALGVALYGMFVAIVVPPAVDHRPVAFVALISMGLSLILYYVPFFKAHVTGGFSIIICTLLSAGFGAAFFPTPDEAKKEKEAVS